MSKEKVPYRTKRGEQVGWAWFTQKKGALIIGMTGDDGKIDRDMMFMIFTKELDAVRAESRRSCEVFRQVRVDE